jgi:heme a synthase
MTTSTTDEPIYKPTPGLRAFAKLLCLATLALVFMGGLVKSHEAGLSVPDWPTTYGENMFTFHYSKWIGPIFYEHSHRLVASVVGFMTLLLSAWLAVVARPFWMKMLGFASLAAVFFQGILGGVTVLMGLPAIVSTAHGVLAQAFFIMVIVLAYGLSKERWRRERDPEDRSDVGLACWCFLLTACVFVQLVFGAAMRHIEAGLAIPDFPTMAGGWAPPFNEASVEWINAWRAEKDIETIQYLAPVTLGQVVIHFLHRVGAILVLAVLAVVNFRALREGRDRGTPVVSILLLDALILAQVALGVATIWTVKEPLVTSVHVVVGAAILGMSALVMLRAMPVRLGDVFRGSDEPTTAPVAVEQEATS